MTNMARPIAASPAATVSTNMEKTCPTRSPRKALNATRLMFTARNINSIAIRIMMMFLRLMKMPSTPRTKGRRLPPDNAAYRSQLDPLPNWLTDIARGLFGTATDLLCHILRPDPAAGAVSQHDSTDHGYQQNEPSCFEKKNVPGKIGRAHV